MIQELIARSLSVGLGTYKQAVGSLHLYDPDKDPTELFLEEGVQSTIAMPAMPVGDPWPSIRILSDAESELRKGHTLDNSRLGGLDPYWHDLVRLLEVFRYQRNRDITSIKTLRDQVFSPLYHLFIDQKVAVLQSQAKPGSS